MVSCFIAAFTCLCVVNAYRAPDFLKGKFRRADECSRIQPVSRDISDKIVGGQDADHGEYPWQVNLQKYSQNSYTQFCGGSILDEQTIITAAHCTACNFAEMLQVVAGDYKLDHDDGTEQTVGVSRIITHRYFNRTSYQNDIALLKLSSPLDLRGKYARPICLPSVQKEEPYGYATAIGWGIVKDGTYANVLQEVSVPLVSDARCRWSYHNTSFPTPADYMLCAGYEEGGKDTCVGDSGGSLVVGRKDGSAILVGIVSWGHPCAWPNQPGVYTQVSYFLDWISKNRT